MTDRSSAFPLSQAVSNKKFLALMLVVVAALIVDTSITKVSAFITSQSISYWRVILFITLSSIYAVTQYLILSYVRSKNRESKIEEPLHLQTIHKVVTVIQYGLVTILLLTILQILFYSFYNLALLVLTMTISYTLAIVMLGLLAQRFFLWFRSNRNAVVLLYGLSSATLAINAALSFAFGSIMIQDKSELVLPRPGIFLPAIAEGSLKDVLSDSHLIASVISFVITWVATALLLRHYSKRLGKVLYWVIMCIPLLYFLSQFLTFARVFDPLIEFNPILSSFLLVLIFSLSRPIGGVLFGLAFWITGKYVGSNVVRYYMTISAFGLVLVFMSNQAVSLATSLPYPPFGLVTISFMGLSSYLILVGVYSSATSVSQDIKLRQSIRKFAVDEVKLLDSIGSAEMEQKIRSKVMGMIKRTQTNMTEETGIQSSLNEENLHSYLDQVLKEVKGGKEEKGSEEA